MPAAEPPTPPVPASSSPSSSPPTDGALRGRVALVTGAGRGIGRAIARRFLQEGAAVCLADIDRDALDDAAAEYAALGRLEPLVLDVSDESQVAAGVGRCADALGGLDILVNNAASSDPVSGPIERLDLADWQRTLAVGLTGPMLLVKHAVPHLRRARGGGRVINIGSIRALMSEPNTEGYAAAKGGLTALTHALAISLGPDVRVNVISPGWIDTSDYAPRPRRAPADLRPIDHHQHPAGRVGHPHDVAALCAFLASDAASFLTGHNLPLDGGLTRKMIYAD